MPEHTCCNSEDKHAQDHSNESCGSLLQGLRVLGCGIHCNMVDAIEAIACFHIISRLR